MQYCLMCTATTWKPALLSRAHGPCGAGEQKSSGEARCFLHMGPVFAPWALAPAPNVLFQFLQMSNGGSFFLAEVVVFKV
jgi:hypothetical protein